METVSGDAGRPRSRKALGCLAAALLGAGAILQPQVANAAHSGGGSGGFHGDGGGFHGGGFHAGGVHHGFGRFRGGFGGGCGGIYAPYWWDYGYPDYDYG